jgi:hypothetical protein
MNEGDTGNHRLESGVGWNYEKTRKTQKNGERDNSSKGIP